MIVDAPWYVPNMVIWRDLQTPKIKGEIHHYSSQYSACLSVHLTDLAVNLMAQLDNKQLQDTSQMICLPDSKCICSLVLKV
jgi:hypothetical protein